MAELNNVDVNIAPAQRVETTPKTEIELHERQAISTDSCILKGRYSDLLK